MYRFLLPLLIVATPGLAEGQRDPFQCVGMQTCDFGGHCYEGGQVFGLAFLGGGIEVEMNGDYLTPAYDGTLRTSAWVSGGVVYQMHITGDGTGVLASSREVGEAEMSALTIFHCSPE
ncbi:MAG: hypothetical protein KDK12_16530 [Rhodobacteraceae bacterium]|nr:hypothetical protein [Paracoccaceae bacterium]